MNGEEIRKRLEAAGSEVETVPTKALGDVYMRKISGEMRDALISVQDKLQPRADGKKSLPAPVVIAACLCDETGAPLYEFDVAIRTVGKLPADQQDELFGHALRVTGLGARALEEAEKKSASSQSEESGTN